MSDTQSLVATARKLEGELVFKLRQCEVFQERIKWSRKRLAAKIRDTRNSLKGVREIIGELESATAEGLQRLELALKEERKLMETRENEMKLQHFWNLLVAGHDRRRAIQRNKAAQRLKERKRWTADRLQVNPE